MLVTASREKGVLEAEEQEMLHKVFEFADKDAADVMVPRPDVVAVPAELPVTELLRVVLDHPFTRYPVFEEDLDDIIGILHVRDLFSALHDRGMDRVDLRAILRTAIVVPETKHLDELLAEFQTTSNHMAIVVDEYGSVEGLVTLEDLLEEIVGEIGDEFDAPEAGILRIGRGRVRIGGSFPIDEFNERFGIDLPDDDYHTVGGFVFGELGRAPKVGDTVGFDGARFEVASTDGPRIIEVDVTLSTAGAAGGRRRGAGRELARRARRSSRPSSTSAAVIPPALWLTQRSVTVSHEIETSGWWSAASAASRDPVQERHRAAEIAARERLLERAVAHLPAVQLPDLGLELGALKHRHRPPPGSSDHNPSYGGRYP